MTAAGPIGIARKDTMSNARRVYNNAVARLRRVSASFEEASADLGATTFQTFRHVTRLTREQDGGLTPAAGAR